MQTQINNKGNWEFSFFQKTIDTIAESNIKTLLKPDNGFNPRNVHNYINPGLSKEEQLLIKKNNGEKLKNTETIILNNYLTKKIENIKNDIKLLKIHNVNAKPVTKEGKTRLLLKILENQLQKNNKDAIANVYLRLMEDQFNITEEIEKEYNKQILYMNKIINELDLTELQFTKFYSQMPPLNEHGFKKFDEWQINVINNIDNNISTVVNAPTSAGKSVLSGYVSIKGRTIYVVPTDALAWQMSAFIGNILGENIPLITETYQTNPTRDSMIELLNNSIAIVGTPDILVDYLPFIKNNFKWLVCDEIHMIGKTEGSSMEYIIKLLLDNNNNLSILALSATVGNTEELTNWLKKLIPNKFFSQIICNKRFFNLQKYYYDQIKDELVIIHPLAFIDNEEIKNGNILHKTIDPTPPTIWDLALKLKEKFNLNELDPHIYFDKTKRIELNDTYIYFNKLLKFMVDNYNEDIIEVLNNYKNINSSEIDNKKSIDIVKLAFKLKSENKTPTIIFHKNTTASLKMIYDFAKNVDNLENIKYPKLFDERIKLLKTSKKIEKKIDLKLEEDSKKSIKLMLNNDTSNTVPIITSLQEPHEDFIFNNNQYFTEYIIEKWANELKKYFPNSGEYYHFIIKLLWRGVGIYAKGLPDPYLRLVQSLASSKQLAIVFSDQSLVFGISMPFRSVVIINDNKYSDDLESMLFHQMSGRAGRRGLDKEGNIIFAGYSWDRIKELSTSEIPNIIGINKLIYTTKHANKLSELYNTSQNWKILFSNLLKTDINNDELDSINSIIENNYNNSWNFGINNNINHLYMNWKFRHSEEGIIISYLLPYIEKAFENKDHTLESNQILLAHFLSKFIEIKNTDITDDILEDPELFNLNPFNNIINQLHALNIDINNNIDNKLYLSILNNSLYKNNTNIDDLRQRLINFGNKLKNIQHYYYYSKITNIAKILGKLLTRIWWIYHTSSPIMKSLNDYNND
jgi:superfamily II RNA helicase